MQGGAPERGQEDLIFRVGGECSALIHSAGGAVRLWGFEPLDTCGITAGDVNSPNLKIPICKVGAT